MAEGTNFVISFTGDISDIQRKIQRLDKVNKTIAKNFGKDFTRATEIVSRSLDKISRKRIVLKGGKEATQEIRQFSTVIRTANGSLKTLTETTKRVGDGAIKPLNTTIRDGGKVTRGFSDNLKTLAKRAALTIPLWFAIRQGIGSIFRTIRGGLSDLIEFDRALQKLRRNVSATSTSLEKDFRNITAEIERFSIESGVSVQEITRAIQRFATVGFDIETSLKGGIDATKLAVNLFGDAEETANAFARSLRVLTADLDSAEEQQQAISEALALTDQLWQTNAFEVSEFSSNLEKFAGTAKVANLSIEDTLTLLATLSTAGISGRSGRLLRSTLLRALADFENINRELGLGLDPDETPTIDFVLRLVEALKELRSRDNIPVELTETLADLFTIRGTEVLAGLTAIEKILKENIALTPDVQALNETFEFQNEQINRLVERFKNLNVILSRTFVTGLIGGKDFENALGSIIEKQEELISTTNNFGRVLNAVFRGRTTDLILELFEELPGRIGDSLSSSADIAGEKSAEIVDNINEAFKQQLDLQALNQLISDIETFGGTNLGIEQVTLDRVLERLQIEKQILEVKEDQVVEEERNQIRRKTTQEISEAVLKNELDLLKAQGATASQIIEAEIALRNQLGIQGDVIDQVQRQLQAEREITEEQRLRSELGNESIKLFRIAQTEGIQVARRLGDVLSGELDFATFFRQGGRELEVFTKEFANILEQQRAIQFFTGQRVSGLPQLRGGGGVAIEEEAIRRRGTPLFDPGVALEQSRAESLLRRIEADVNIASTLRVEITGLSTSQVGDKIKDDIIKEMQNPNSDFSKQLSQNINDF